MADTYTTNLNLTKPEPGAAEDTWGISLNADLDSLDAIFSSSGTQINLNPNQINFADNKKAIFGTGSDLQIYHDSSNGSSVITEAGGGDLLIKGANLRLQSPTGENYFVAINNSSSYVYYDGSAKLATTSTGIDVTGTATMDGLTVSATTATVNIAGGNTGASLINFGDAADGNVGRIYYDHSADFMQFKAADGERLRINSTGIDVTGTVTADGATIAGTLELDSNNLDHTALSPQYNMIESDITGNNTQFLQVGGDLRIRTIDDSKANPVERLRIDHASGDISFYDNTGSTQGLFWDASAESLGIGTTSPDAKLSIHAAVNNPAIEIVPTTDENSADSAVLRLWGTRFGTANRYSEIRNVTDGSTANNELAFNTNGSEALRIDSSQRVGIGTSSPSTYGVPNAQNLVIGQGGASTGITLSAFGTASSSISFSDQSNPTSARGYMKYDHNGDYLAFAANGSEKARLNSSGIDVTGTVKSDGGLIEGSTGLTIRNDAVGANEPKLVFDNDVFSGANHAQIQTGNGGLQLIIESPSTSTFQNRHKVVLNGGGGDDVTFSLSTDNGTSYKNSFKIDNNDISFYDDTGSTQALFWDASAERLGIGTTSPASKLHLADTSTVVTFEDTNSTNNSINTITNYEGTMILSVDPNNNSTVTESMRFSMLGSERMRLDNNGRLGIGTTSPDALLEINKGSEGEYLRVGGDNASNARSLRFTSSTSSTGSIGALHTIKANSIGGEIAFANGDGTIMYLKDGGNVGIGTDSPNAKLDVSSATGSSSITPTELLISSSTQAGDWSLTEPWGVLGFYSADTSGGGAGSLAEISANMENTVGGFASLDFKLQNPAQSYAKTSWLTLKNSSSFATRQVLIEADGGLYVEGNVGIGTDSPSAALNIVKSGLSTQFRVSNTESDATTKYGAIVGSHYTNAEEPIAGMLMTSSSSVTGGSVSIGGGISAANAVNNILFYTAANNTTLTGSERMRITSDGNFLVDKTAIGLNTVGFEVRPNGIMASTRDGGSSAYFNRKTSDGSVVEFQKDGTTGGVIGIQEPQDNAPELYIANGTGTNSTGLAFWDYIYPTRRISPCNGAGTYVDNAIDLGWSSARFKDLYLSGGLRGDTTFKNNAGTTEYGRFDSSGNLLVGQSAQISPGFGNTQIGSSLRENGSAAFSRVGNSTQPTLMINKNTNDGIIASFQKDGTQVGSIGTQSGADFYITGSNAVAAGLRFQTNEIVPVNGSASNRDAAIDIGKSNVRFKDLYLSGGVQLGGTGAANKLDDYEEGTWTPVFADAATGGNVATVSSANGSYTKVGNLVTVGCNLSDIDITGMTSSNAIYIRGLPFTTGTTQIRSGSAFLDRVTFSGYVTAYATGSHVLLFSTSTGAFDAALLVSSIDDVGSDVFFTVQYQV